MAEGNKKWLFLLPPFALAPHPALNLLACRKFEAKAWAAQLCSGTSVRAAPRLVKYQLSGPGRRVS